MTGAVVSKYLDHSRLYRHIAILKREADVGLGRDDAGPLDYESGRTAHFGVGVMRRDWSTRFQDLNMPTVSRA